LGGDLLTFASKESTLSRGQLGGIKFELLAKKYTTTKDHASFGETVGLYVLGSKSSMWIEFI